MQNVAAVGIIERDIKARERRLQRGRIALQLARRHGDVAVAAALLAHEPCDLCGGPFALAVDAPCLIERDGVLPARHRARGTEKAALDVVERTAFLARRQRLLLAGHARVLRKRKELPAHPQALGKELAVMPVAKERHSHAVRPPQQNAQDAQLASREIGEAVKEHVLAVDIARRFKVFLQLLQRIARVAPRRVELYKIYAV